jgi:hypothetical protein
MGADTTPMLTVAAITAPEVDQAVAVVCLAFCSDPAARWTYPDPYTYLSYFPKIVRAFGGRALSMEPLTR